MLEGIFKGFILFAKTALPVLACLFVAALLGIIIIRIVLRIILHFARKNYLAFKQNLKLKRETKNKKLIPKEDDELMKVKKEEIASYQSPNVEKMPSSREEENEKQELDEVTIVDIVKPVGFWTSMVLGQKLTYLISSAQIMNKNNHKGFWVSMVEAQEMAQGRQKGRSL